MENKRTKPRPAQKRSPDPPDTPVPSSRLPVPVAAAVLLVVGALFYANSFKGVFVLDDQSAIVDNPFIRKVFPLGETMFGPRDMRPVVSLSLAINYAISGLNRWSYHAFNLLVHLLAALLLMGIIRRTLLSDRLKGESGAAAAPLALAVAMIWMVHPLQTGSVTYICQRSEAMMGMFYLLTLYSVIRGHHSSGRGRWAWYVAAVASCAVGMGCKQVMVTAPLVVLMYDRVFLSTSFSGMFRRRWGVYAALGAVWAILAVLFVMMPAGGAAGFGLRTVTWKTYALTQPGVIMHYIGLALWPKDLVLDYQWMFVRDPMEAVAPIIKVGVLVLATGIALRFWPVLGFLGAWFFIILAPTSSVMPIADAAFEHRMYLSLAAVVVLVVMVGYAAGSSLLGRAGSRESRRVIGTGLGATVLVGLVLALGLATWKRSAVYADKVTMWIDVIRKRRQNPRAYLNLSITQSHLAGAAEQQGRPDEAKRYWDAAKANLEISLGLNDGIPKTWNNLGLILGNEGKMGAAVEHFEKGIALYRQGLPAADRLDFAGLHFNLAVAFERQGRRQEKRGQRQEAREHYVEALKHYAQAVKVYGAYVPAYNNRGHLLQRMDDSKAAAEVFGEALKIAPEDESAHAGLGVALSELGDLDRALEHCRRSVAINPGSIPARGALGAVLVKRGDLSAAAEQFARVLELNPDSREARRDLDRVRRVQASWREKVTEARQRHQAKPDDPTAANALARVLATAADAAVRDGPEAVKIASKAVAADPTNTDYLDTLAAAHAEAGNFQKAIDAAQEAFALAGRAGRTEAAAEYRKRLRLYQAHQPYRDLSER